MLKNTTPHIQVFKACGEGFSPLGNENILQYTEIYIAIYHLIYYNIW